MADDRSCPQSRLLAKGRVVITIMDMRETEGTKTSGASSPHTSDLILIRVMQNMTLVGLSQLQLIGYSAAEPGGLHLLRLVPRQPLNSLLYSVSKLHLANQTARLRSDAVL